MASLIISICTPVLNLTVQIKCKLCDYDGAECHIVRGAGRLNVKLHNFLPSVTKTDIKTCVEDTLSIYKKSVLQSHGTYSRFTVLQGATTPAVKNH